MTRNSRRNYRKLRILTALEKGTWMRPAALAVAAGVWPIRGIYAKLSTLCRWGLLARRRDTNGFLVYRITRRGRDRLVWVRKNLA